GQGTNLFTMGNGRAIIDGENMRSFGFYSGDKPVANIVIADFEIRNMKYTGVAWAGGSAIKIDDAAAVTVAHCYLHEIGYWKNDGSVVPAGSGINLIRPVHCTIADCEVTKTGLAGIQLDGAVACTVARNDVHDYITWGIDLGGDYNLCTENVIGDNSIHDLYQYDAGYYGGAGDPPHTDYVFIRKGGAESRRPLKNIVEGNLFYNNAAFKEFGGTAMLFLSYADSTIVRRNVFINAHGYYAVFFGWTSRGTDFSYNTIYSPRTGAVRLETGGNNDINHNIFICASQGIGYQDSADEKNLQIDYNLYTMPADNKSFAQAAPFTGWSFTAWQARGFDTHSALLPEVAQYGFVSLRGYPRQCRTMNLERAPGGAHPDAGAWGKKRVE
ncbi:MAG: right-handed parallel beta-helix repeat-containing protein, partial [Chitinivibrionales bacterium]|nr:right-handed parallel beta-helix repeat-containing protein [Chitinivibrionales bacterium]